MKKFLCGLAVGILLAGCTPDRDWRSASREPAGIAPHPATTREAVLQVYAAPAWGWRGWFAVHTWIAAKRNGQPHYTVYEVIGWRERRGFGVFRCCASSGMRPTGSGSTRLARFVHGRRSFRHGTMPDMNARSDKDDADDSPAVSCASCEACCCRLEVLLMGQDDIPMELAVQDQWGGWVMLRLDDGWCAALDRNAMRCTIYERRPMICREYQVGESECIGERRRLVAQQPTVRAGVVTL